MTKYDSNLIYNYIWYDHINDLFSNFEFRISKCIHNNVIKCEKRNTTIELNYPAIFKLSQDNRSTDFCLSLFIQRII